MMKSLWNNFNPNMDALHNKAVELLARREHSQFELKQKLLQRGFAAKEIELLMARLAQTGLQSDQRFAEAYLNKRAAAGYGPKQIAAELKQRGIVEIPELLLEENHVYWQNLLQQVWYKKFAARPENAKERARQINFLLYRGFNVRQIQQLLKGEDNE